jgi:hypothetical protein
MFLLSACLGLAGLQACGSLPRRDAVSALSTMRAVTPEAPTSRYWPVLDIRPMLHVAVEARQPVVWNMGEIASSTDPRALDLFGKVMLASTAIPGIFPPVMIDVEVDGRSYQGACDGGVMTQGVFGPTQRSCWHPRPFQASFRR